MKRVRLGVVFAIAVALLVIGKFYYEYECAKPGRDCPKSEPIDYEKDGIPEVGIET